MPLQGIRETLILNIYNTVAPTGLFETYWFGHSYNTNAPTGHFKNAVIAQLTITRQKPTRVESKEE